MVTRTTTHDTDGGKVPMSRGREVHRDVPLRFPVGRDVGTVNSFRWLEGEELFLNMLISGGKGKGKTAGVIKPFLRFLVCHPARAGALVLDVKGDLAPYVRGWAALAGREADVVDIDPRGNTRVHLFPRGMHAEILANAIITSAQTLAGGVDPKEAFWLNSAEELCKFLALLLQMLREDLTSPVTPADILELVGQDDELQRLVNRLEMRREERDGRLTAEEKHIYDYIQQYYNRHHILDSRVRTSYEAELHRILRDFTNYRFKMTFCPHPDDKDTVSVEDILTAGKLVILSMPHAEYFETSRFVALMLKAQFYSAALRRIREGNMANARPAFFICDEYQNFATIGGRVGSDDNFAALSRQAKVGMICATQELGSLYAVAGPQNSEAVANMLQNFQTHVVLQQTLTPKMNELLKGKGIKDTECIPKLKAFEALFYKDTAPVPRLIELGPTFGTWDYAAAVAGKELADIAERKHSVIGVLGHPQSARGLRTVIAGSPKSRKSEVLDNQYDECLLKDVPCLRYNARFDVPESVVARLAEVCAYDRGKMENAVIFVDDVDTMSDDKTHPSSHLYYALLPFFSGSRVAYGKGYDRVNLALVDIVMTATSRRRGDIHSRDEATPCVELPGRVADGVRVLDIQSLGKSAEIERLKA